MRLNQHTILLLLLSLYSGNLFAANTGAVKGQVVEVRRGAAVAPPGAPGPFVILQPDEAGDVGRDGRVELGRCR
ncbi:MAG: hypothetical protein AAF570_25530, partial [Bacteroidota bacterium]